MHRGGATRAAARRYLAHEALALGEQAVVLLVAVFSNVLVLLNLLVQGVLVLALRSLDDFARALVSRRRTSSTLRRCGWQRGRRTRSERGHGRVFFGSHLALSVRPSAGIKGRVWGLRNHPPLRLGRRRGRRGERRRGTCGGTLDRGLRRLIGPGLLALRLRCRKKGKNGRLRKSQISAKQEALCLNGGKGRVRRLWAETVTEQPLGKTRAPIGQKTSRVGPACCRVRPQATTRGFRRRPPSDPTRCGLCSSG